MPLGIILLGEISNFISTERDIYFAVYFNTKFTESNEKSSPF